MLFQKRPYYAQPFKKTAIVTDQFKYIFNKKTKPEELDDLKWDPIEDYNILRYKTKDFYRGYRLREMLYKDKEATAKCFMGVANLSIQVSLSMYIGKIARLSLETSFHLDELTL